MAGLCTRYTKVITFFKFVKSFTTVLFKILSKVKNVLVFFLSVPIITFSSSNMVQRFVQSC